MVIFIFAFSEWFFIAKERSRSMQKMTSAYANKMIRTLEEEKSLWVTKEKESCTYVAAVNEEPVIPEYDYAEVSEKIREIDEKIAIIKHAINLSNSTAKVLVGGTVMSVDTILIRMAQLSRRKQVLDLMRKALPKSRVESRGYYGRNATPEYCYTNYDPEQVKKDFEIISASLMEMQMALDNYNQTEQFDVDI